jgi:hypothetical protein
MCGAETILNSGGYVVIRKAVRTVMIMLAALVIPAAILTVQLPAGAATGQLCETNNTNNYCLNTADFNLYTVVKEGGNGNGRTISEDAQGGKYANYPTYLLRFNGDSSKCVGSSNDIQTVEIKPCNGGTGIVWARVTVSNNVYQWINVYASKNNDQGQYLYLTGRGIQGSGYIMVPVGSYGLYQKFSFG